jgi:hypothetical protein
MREFFTNEKTFVLNYLTLSISDKEITKQFQLTNACMMHSIYWMSFSGFTLLLVLQSFNYLFRDGQPVYILLQLAGYCFMGLWYFLWRFSKLNVPKSIMLQLVLQVGIPALLFWDMLGPFNCPPEEKYLFIEHQVQSFLIVTIICVNSF